MLFNKNGALAALLLLSTGTAMAANWVRVGTPAKVKNSAGTFYIDRDSIVKSGKLYKVWSLTSVPREQRLEDGTVYQAVKALHLYSCEERTSTLKAQVYYADLMGKGNVLQNIKYEKFGPEDVVPDSVQDHALRIACPKADPAAPAAPGGAPAGAAS